MQYKIGYLYSILFIYYYEQIIISLFILIINSSLIFGLPTLHILYEALYSILSIYIYK